MNALLVVDMKTNIIFYLLSSTSSFGSASPGYCDKTNILSSLNDDNNIVPADTDNENKTSKYDTTSSSSGSNTNCSFPGNELRSSKSLSNVEDCKKNDKQKLGEAATSNTTTTTTSSPVEVFLGGSCNPTTWRADVAIPALKESGISFYNPVRTKIYLNSNSNLTNFLDVLISFICSKYPIGRQISLNLSIALRRKRECYSLLWIQKHARLLVP